jgi:hypothetical protein
VCLDVIERMLIHDMGNWIPALVGVLLFVLSLFTVGLAGFVAFCLSLLLFGFTGGLLCVRWSRSRMKSPHT